LEIDCFERKTELPRFHAKLGQPLKRAVFARRGQLMKSGMLRMWKLQFDADCYQKRVPLTFAKV